MTVEVSIIVSPDLARALHSGTHHASVDALHDAAEANGAQLRAVHPDTGDPELMKFFHAWTSDFTIGERMAAQIRGIDGVEAAYPKPPDDVP